MNTHLALVAQVTDISPILALRSLFQWEGEFESTDYEPALRVCSDQAAEGLRTLFAGGDADPCITGLATDDDITFQLGSSALCADLAKMLAAIGMGRGKGTDVLLKEAAEPFYDRVLTLDSAWVLLRRIRATSQSGSDIVATAQTILQLACDWHILRTELSNKGSSPARAAREREIVARAKAFPGWGMNGLRSVELMSDPRGSALTLSMDGYHSFSVSALQFGWPTGTAACVGTTSKQVRSPRGRYDVTPTRVDDRILGVLNAVAIDGDAVRIIGRLEKTLYGKVDELLQGLGGKWHTGRQAHVFDDAPQSLIQEVLRTGEVLLPRDYEFFETQPAQVEQVIQLARIEPEMKVLEPQAGRGALAMAAAEIVGKAGVTCFELMPRNVKHLRELGFNIQEPQDFLSVQPKAEYDRIVLNPPFSGGRDIAHIQHAVKFLRPGGRLVAIASTQWRDRVTKASAGFQQMLGTLRAEVRDIPRGAFKAVGTDVPTTLIAFNVPSAPAKSPMPATEGLAQLAFF